MGSPLGHLQDCCPKNLPLYHPRHSSSLGWDAPFSRDSSSPATSFLRMGVWELNFEMLQVFKRPYSLQNKSWVSIFFEGLAPLTSGPQCCISEDIFHSDSFSCKWPLFLLFENLGNCLLVPSVLSFCKEVSKKKKNLHCWVRSRFFRTRNAMSFSSRISAFPGFSIPSRIIILELLFRYWLSWTASFWIALGSFLVEILLKKTELTQPVHLVETCQMSHELPTRQWVGFLWLHLV